MYPDFSSFVFGASVGALVATAGVLYLLREALAAYQRERAQAIVDEQRRQADAKRQAETELLERVTAMVRDILKVRASVDPDDPHPLKTLDVAESSYLQLVREAQDAANRVDLARHTLNYKNEKGK